MEPELLLLDEPFSALDAFTRSSLQHDVREISKELDCAWQLVIDRLEALGRLDDYEKVQPIKDWSKDRSGGPRSFKLEDF